MATPGGKQAGRVSVRVVPDSTKFREDLKKVFLRIERTMQIKIPVHADTDPARDAVRKLIKDVDGKKVTLNTDVDGGATRVRLAALTRPRRVSILPEVSTAAAAKATAALAALSGARVLQDRLRGIGEGLANLDRNLPRFAAVATTIANLSSVLLASTSGLAGVAVGLVSISGAALALPGIVGGVAAGVGVMVLALKDAATQLAVVGPRFTELQQSISGEFWARARGPIVELVNSLLPQLQAGTDAVAASLGTWAASLAAGLQAAMSGGQLQVMFDNLATSIDISATASGAMASIITTLGVSGSQYLPRLAQALADVTTELAGFLDAAAQDGRLEAWIETGIAAGQQLVGVFANVGQILGAVGQAAIAVGSGGLAALNSALGQAAQIMSGPAFQTTLQTLFAGAGEAVSALAGALAPLGDMLSALAPSLSTIMVTAGQAVAGVVTQIAEALSQPAFSTGLVALFDGLAAGIAGLGPAIGPVAAALGQLGAFAGELAAQMGPLIGQTLALLAPILGDILTTLQPLLPVLSGVLLQAIQTLAPWISTIVTALLPPLVQAVSALAEALGPLLASLEPLTPVFETIATNIGALLPVLAQLVTQSITQLVQLLPPIIGAMAAWAQATAPLIPAFADLVASMIPLMGALTPIVTALLPDLVGLFKQTLEALAPSTAAVIDLMGSFGELATEVAPLVAEMMPALIELTRLLLVPVLALASGFLGVLVPALSRSADGLKIIADDVRGFADRARAMRDTVSDVAGTVAAVFQRMRETVTSALSSAGTWLLESGRALIDGFARGIRDRISAAVDAASAAVSAVRDFFPGSPAKRGPFSGRGWVLYSGRAVGDAFAKGIQERTAVATAATSGMLARAHPGSAGALQSAASYRGGANAGATGVGDQVVVEMSGTYYSYDPTELADAAVKKARQAQSVRRLRAIAKGV